jgi:hypothetical protein
LRDALGESADTPVFIETLARRGHRFIGPVEGRVAQSGIGVEAATEQSKLSFVRPCAAIAILLCVGIGALIWVLWRQPWRPKEIIERKLTTNSSENSVGSAGISPDGKYLAYTDNTGMYLKQVRTSETHPVSLPANSSGFVSDWFPDGSHLLVAREEQSGKQSFERPVSQECFSFSVFSFLPVGSLHSSQAASVAILPSALSAPLFATVLIFFTAGLLSLASLSASIEHGRDRTVWDWRVLTVWESPSRKRRLAATLEQLRRSCVRGGRGWQGELKSCAAPRDTCGP